MEHGQAGVSWGPDGASVGCRCGWHSDPVPVGPGWIEALTDALDGHMEES